MLGPVSLNIDEELKKCSTMEDLTGKNGLLQRILGPMIEKMLEAEMDEELGYDRYSRQSKDNDNRRNGETRKGLKTSVGEVEIAVPRDRQGKFQPKLIKKHQRNISSFDDKIISMYARGMTTRDIQAHVKEIYGADISPTTVSNITEKVMDTAAEWQSRPLKEVYPIVYLDAIHYKVKEEGQIISKAAYTCLGVDLDGRKDVLGIWVGESEGARFWMRVCSELKNRGVQDIYIACIDGLKGFPEAIQAVFPGTAIQLCVIHLIRNTFKYIPYKYGKDFMKDLKVIYRAPSEAVALKALDALSDKWEKKYPLAVRPWRNQWENIRTFFQFPEPVRRLIYTTNAVEAVHRQLRKVTKNRSVFPNDQALTKILYLAIEGIMKKWTLPIRDWATIIGCLLVVYGNRVSNHIKAVHA